MQHFNKNLNSTKYYNNYTSIKGENYMKNRKLKTYIVFTIAILFFGAGILPIAYGEKSTISNDKNVTITIENKIDSVKAIEL